MKVRYYHKETGILAPNVLTCSDASIIVLNAPADHLPIESPPAGLDHLSQRIDVSTRAPVDYRPPPPSPDHEWSATTKRWQLNAAAQSKLDARRGALSQIWRLEASQPRALREAVLGAAGGRERLQGIEDQIKALRAEL